MRKFVNWLEQNLHKICVCRSTICWQISLFVVVVVVVSCHRSPGQPSPPLTFKVDYSWIEPGVIEIILYLSQFSFGSFLLGFTFPFCTGWVVASGRTACSSAAGWTSSRPLPCGCLLLACSRSLSQLMMMGFAQCGAQSQSPPWESPALWYSENPCWRTLWCTHRRRTWKMGIVVRIKWVS